MLNQEIEIITCPVCNKNSTKLWMSDGKVTRYVICTECRTIYASPRYTQKKRLENISKNYSDIEKVLSMNQARRPALEKEAKIIQKFKNNGRMLDIGCSSGVFFDYFNSKDWECFGVELSPSMAKFASESHGIPVIPGTLFSAKFPSKSFDLITITDTFYYIDDPVSELAEIHRILNHNGLLCIEIPGQSYLVTSSRGIICLVINGRWNRLDTASAYVYWYTPESLCKLLSKQGYKIIAKEIIYSPIKKGWIGGLSRGYGIIVSNLARKFSKILTWAPKIIFIAVPVE